MNRALELLDINGIQTPAGAEKFAFSRSLREIGSFTTGFRRAMLEDQRLAQGSHALGLDEANYLPSATMRGDSGCGDWRCRLPKIRSMSRYIALYSDRAILPIKFPGMKSKTRTEAEFLDRHFFFSTLLGVVELRPLIDAGLLVLVPEELRLCEEHWNEAIPEHRRIARVASVLANQNTDKFSITYEPPSDFLGRAVLHYQGPEEYIEHGSIVTVLDQVPSWLQNGSQRRKTLSKKAVRSNGLVRRIFMRMANDAFLQSYFAPVFNARYVTNSIGEAQFFHKLYERDELAQRSSNLLAELSHSVPIMNEIPVKRVLELRSAEPEAFQAYRSTLSEIIKEHVGRNKSVSKSDARQIYCDVLKPQIDTLELQAANFRRSALKKSAVKAVASALLVGLGVHSGLLPANITNLVTAIGGLSVASNFVSETITAIEKNPEQVRNHNLYFLLRLKQTSR